MKDEIAALLAACKATPVSVPRKGGRFYQVLSQDFTLPSGEKITREFIEKPVCSIVVPITVDGHILCTFQPIALSEEGSLLELPAGRGDPGEDAQGTAIRELVEETGYVPGEIFCVGKHYQDPGSIKAPVWVFIALECEKRQEQNLDADEHIKAVEVSHDTLYDMWCEGEILDANTFIALAKYFRLAGV